MILFGSYFMGFVPAFLAALMSSILLWSHRGSGEEISANFAVLLGCLSGVLVALGLAIFFSLWIGGESAKFWLGFFADFAVPGAACGIFNKVAWRQLWP